MNAVFIVYVLVRVVDLQADQRGGFMKVAVVTGTSSGLGNELVHQLLKDSWYVIGVSRRPLEISHPNYQHQCLDLSNPEAVEAFFNTFPSSLQESPSCLALVNNAGQLGKVDSVAQLDMGSLIAATQLNFITPLWLMGFLRRSFPDALLRIVNVSSGASRKPYEGWALYCCTKAALKMATEVMAAELHPNTFLFSYEPGVMDTPMQEEIRQSDREIFLQKQKFLTLFHDNSLVDPKFPAAEMLAFLNNDQTQVLTTARYGAKL